MVSVRDFPDRAVRSQSPERRRIPTAMWVQTTTSRLLTLILPCSIKMACRYMVRYQSIRCGADSAEAARPTTTVIRPFSTTPWRIAGSFRSFLSRPRRTCSAWPYRRPTIRPVRTIDMFFRTARTFLTIRRWASGRTRITSRSTYSLTVRCSQAQRFVRTTE